MKRYRLLNLSIDTIRNCFKHQIYRDAEMMKRELRAFLISQYGELDFDKKFSRYMQLEKPAVSIVTEHALLLEDICNSYVQGNFYSALTGACCLGERIFNDILFKVMDDFKSSDHYKCLYNKDSVIDWEKAIKILFDWSIIDNDIKEKYIKLSKLRTNSVHYQKKTQDLTEMVLSAINLVNFIINKLFSIDRKDILIYLEVPGEIFIKKDAEKDPIVKKFFIPCSVLVGPKYKIISGNKPGQLKIIDEEKYENQEINDAQFVKLRNEFTGKSKS